MVCPQASVRVAMVAGTGERAKEQSCQGPQEVPGTRKSLRVRFRVCKQDHTSSPIIHHLIALPHHRHTQNLGCNYKFGVVAVMVVERVGVVVESVDGDSMNCGGGGAVGGGDGCRRCWWRWAVGGVFGKMWTDRTRQTTQAIRGTCCDRIPRSIMYWIRPNTCWGHTTITQTATAHYPHLNFAIHQP